MVARCQMNYSDGHTQDNTHDKHLRGGNHDQIPQYKPPYNGWDEFATLFIPPGHDNCQLVAAFRAHQYDAKTFVPLIAAATPIK